MKRWFARLPIHRKLVVMALLVTTMALLIVSTGLVLVDLWRFRSVAHDEVIATARVLAENTVAAVAFGDAEAARATLDSVRVRPSVRRACLYLPDGTLFAGAARGPEYACPATQPVRGEVTAGLAGTAEVVSNDRIIGTVYVERDAGNVWMRVGVALAAGLGLLVLAGLAALLLANRLHRAISGPIAQLAASARAIQPGRAHDVPTPEPPAEDEIGELVRAFGEMLRRVRDATAEREALLTREREANRLKDEFLAAVSHELRTPLNAITGWAHILTAAPPDPETLGKGLAAIARNAKAQTRVIEDLVDVSRIVTGKLAIRFDPVDLREVVEHAVEAARAPAAAKRLRLQVDVPRGVCLVNGDRERLQQVMANLLSNAMKFTPPDGTIAVSLTPAGGMFALVVADTGIGIPAAFLPHVFDRFRQADGSMTREHGGLGLGLAIVKELVELHGGSVLAESAGPGRGARFIVRLPALAGFHAELPPPPAEAGERLDGVAVLAVDDNADALEVLAAALAGRGARVRTALGGEAAIAAWAQEPADVLVCDLAMPLVTGFDVLRAVRAQDAARGRVTPAIAVSAHASESHQAEALRAGFAAYVAKPFEAPELVRAISGALGRV